GGCGFIGANSVRMLLSAGYRVRILDISTDRAAYLDGLDLEIVRGDICDFATVPDALAGCWAVVHLAAATSVVDSVHDPETTFRVNAAGTLNLLLASLRSGVSRFVIASSNAVLGEQQPPFAESSAPRPRSPYGASKLAGEAYCAAFHASYGLETVVLRFANAYGPFSLHKSSVVARFLKALMNGQPLTIYGDGLQTRDFIYVSDVARAIVLALQQDDAGDLFQIGSGRETSIIDLAHMLQMATGIEPALNFRPQPAGEVRRNYSSIDHARRRLGFEPSVHLQTGLAETFHWFMSERATTSIRRRANDDVARR
ncbi:MAG: NAD-dependent epimerase/dehydratase family protein, partial [Dehalococcoidia bacterium]